MRGLEVTPLLYPILIVVLLFVAAILLLAALALWYALRERSKLAAMWAPFRDLFGGATPELLKPLQTNVGGAPLVVLHGCDGPSDAYAGYLALLRQAPSELQYRITRERVGDRLMHDTGLYKEAQTGDPRFDQAYYLSTNANTALIDYLNADRRAIVDDLFALGATTLELDGGHLGAAFPLPGRGGIEGPGEVRQIASHLDALIDGLPASDSTPIMRPREVVAAARSQFGGRALIFGAIFMCVAGLNLLESFDKRYPPLDTEAVLVLALALAFIAALALGYYSVRVFRHTFRGASKIALVFVMLAFGLPTFLFVGIIHVNGMLDRAAATRVEARVVGKQMRERFEDRPYQLKLASWRPGRQTEIVVVDRELYGISPNLSVAVEVKPGAFGIPWVESVSAVRGQR